MQAVALRSAIFIGLFLGKQVTGFKFNKLRLQISNTCTGTLISYWTPSSSWRSCLTKTVRQQDEWIILFSSRNFHSLKKLLPCSTSIEFLHLLVSNLNTKTVNSLHKRIVRKWILTKRFPHQFKSVSLSFVILELGPCKISIKKMSNYLWAQLYVVYQMVGLIMYEKTIKYSNPYLSPIAPYFPIILA